MKCNWKKLRGIALSAALVLSLGACTSTPAAENTPSSTATPTPSASTEAFSFSAIDPDGVEYPQTLTGAPERIITNNQSTTELLLKLGLEDKIVGTVAMDNPTLPELEEAYAALNIIADKQNISKEQVVGLEPDLILGRAMDFQDQYFGTIPDLNAMGIAIYTQRAAQMQKDVTMDTLVEDVRSIGQILSVQDQTDALADELSGRLDALKTRLAGLSGDPIRVLLMVNYQESGVFAGYGQNATLQKDMLARLNAVNVMEKGGNNLSAENLITMAPDVIVYVATSNNDANDQSAVERLLADPLLQSVPAVSDKRVVTVPYTELMGYGFRTFDCMDTLADYLYPQS